LQKAVNEKVYETDYNQITKTLLFEEVPYEEAITVILKILGDGYFA